MNRPGEPTVEELMARIAALQAQNRQLTERVVKLEEELALARLHRFAPKSEKHIDRLFNEAEQAADEDAADNEDGANLLPQYQNLSLKRSSRPEKIREHPPDQSVQVQHHATASPDSQSTTSRIWFAVGTGGRDRNIRIKQYQ